jgi:hypothetical protein
MAANRPDPAWGDVVGLEASYEVSTDGQVRSLDRIVEYLGWNGPAKMRVRGRLMRVGLLHMNGGVYRSVNLAARGRVKIADLMLETFVGPRPPGNVSRHLNDIRMDDRIENLAWGTQAENVADAIRNGRYRSRGKEPQRREGDGACEACGAGCWASAWCKSR